MRRAAWADWDRRRMWRVAAGIVLSCALLGAPSGAMADEGYVVEYGDTLSAIADAYGVSVEELMWLNGIEDPDLIYAGAYLVVVPPAGSDTGDAVIEESEASAPVDSATDSQQVEGATGRPPYVDPWTIQDQLARAAWLYGWDPNLIMALAWQESGWQQDQVSWVGAIGVMQVMPATAASLDDWYFERDLDVWGSSWDNIEAGVAYLSMLYEETGDVTLALAGYYQGLGSVDADGMFPETEAYVSNILLLRGLFEANVLP